MVLATIVIQIVLVLVVQVSGQEWCKERTTDLNIRNDYYLEASLFGICLDQLEYIGGASWGFGFFDRAHGSGFEYMDSMGLASIPPAGPRTRNCPYTTTFAWASISKTAAGVIAANLAFEGLLDLDARAFDYLFQEPNYFEPEQYLLCNGTTPVTKECVDDGGTLTSKALPNRDFTVRQLLSHKAGMPHFSTHFRYPDMKKKTYEQCPGYDDPNQNTGHRWGLQNCDHYTVYLIAQPGTNYSYSNFGFDLAGVIMEKVSGLGYEELVQKYIAKPLGLKSIDVLAPWKVNTYPNEAFGYDDGPQCPPKARDSWYDMYERGAGGYIVSTTADLYAYAKALHDFDTRLLPTHLSWIEEGKTPHPTKRSAMAYFWEIRKDEDVMDPTKSDNSKSFYSMGIKKKIAPGMYNNINSVNVDAHRTYLSEASHNGLLEQVRSTMHFNWSWTEGVQRPGWVRVIHSNYKEDYSVSAMTKAITWARMRVNNVSMPVFEIGNDNQFDPCPGCGAATRKYRMGLHMNMQGADGVRQFWPTIPNAVGKKQNEPYIFELAWKNPNFISNDCGAMDKFDVDGFMDVEGKHGTMTTADDIFSNLLPPPGVTSNPPVDYWLAGTLYSYADNTVYAWDPNHLGTDYWSTYTAAGFHPVTIQGLRRLDGKVTCFTGVWAYNNHNPQANNYHIQQDVDLHDVYDQFTSNNSIPTSVSLYYDGTTAGGKKLLATVVWKYSDAATASNYMIPRSANGSAALSYEEYSQFFKSRMNECSMGTTLCNCWVPILIDSYTNSTGHDHYLSVWALRPSAKIVHKTRMSEHYFRLLTRPASCDGYRVISYTRHFDVTLDRWNVSAIWEKPICDTPTDKLPGNPEQCEPDPTRKTPRLEPSFPDSGDIDEWLNLDPTFVVRSNFTEYNFNGEPLSFPYPSTPWTEPDINRICASIPDPGISACHKPGQVLIKNICGHFVCFTPSQNITDLSVDHDLEGEEEPNGGDGDEDDISTTAAPTDRGDGSSAIKSSQAPLPFLHIFAIILTIHKVFLQK